MIEVENINGRLGSFELRDINLSVEPGEYRVILGPTGAGKSVLIEYMVGILSPDGGDIRINGRDILSLAMEDRNIGYVPQDYALFPNMDVEKNLAYGLEARGFSPGETQRRVDQWVELLHIESIRHRMPLNLSGGEKQRVALGRALAVSPEIVLMDEPLSALDENLRWEMAGELRRIQKETRATFIHISHNFEEAADVADKITIMDHGSVAQTGSLAELMAAPSSPFVAAFLKTRNIFSARGREKGVELGGRLLETDVSRKGDLTLAIRPEHVRLLPNGDAGVNVFPARVTSCRFKPSHTEVGLDAFVPLVAHVPHGGEIREGQDLFLQIPREKMILI